MAEGLQPHRRLRGILDVARPHAVNGAGASHNYEKRHHVGHDAAENDFEARLGVLLHRDALLHHRRLQVELHPRSYGSAYHPNQHVDVILIQHQPGLQAVDGGFFPVGLHQEARDDVRDIQEATKQEDLLDALVVAFHHQEPHGHGRDRHGDVAADMKQFERTGDARELRHHVGHVGQHQQGHHEERHAQAELFADQVGEALARDRAHARAHLLRDDEDQGDGQQRPQGKIAKAGAGRRIGKDAARIVIDVGGDEPRPEDREENQHVIAEAAEKFSHPSLLP